MGVPWGELFPKAENEKTQELHVRQ